MPDDEEQPPVDESQAEGLPDNQPPTASEQPWTLTKAEYQSILTRLDATQAKTLQVLQESQSLTLETLKALLNRSEPAVEGNQDQRTRATAPRPRFKRI